MLKVKITVKRENGEIEVVYNDNRMLMTPRWQEQAIKSTKAAGKGEILRFEEVDVKEGLTKEQERWELSLKYDQLLEKRSSLTSRNMVEKAVGLAEEINDALKSIKAFDIANPEIKAELSKAAAAKQKESAESAMRS